MELPKVEGTQVRGKIYHLNLRIKPEIQDLYGGKTHLRGSLRTSDPKVARREVQRRKAELHEKEQERARQAEVEDLVSQLSPEQRAAYDAAGGLEGLLEDFERTHHETDAVSEAPSFLVPDRGDGPEDTSSAFPAVPPAQPAAPAPAAASSLDPVDADWPVGDRSAAVLPEDDDGYEEDAVFTLADLLDAYAQTLEPDAAEAMRHIVRLFTEFHGDIAYDELTIAHLDEFAEAARGLPADMMGKLADGTYVRDLPFPEMVAWTVHSEARPISETTRFQYVAMLKELMFFGVPHYRRGDPWSDYRLQIRRRENVEPPVKKPARRFAPSEWTLSDAMMRLLEVAIVVFVLLVLFMLWQSRTT